MTEYVEWRDGGWRPVKVKEPDVTVGGIDLDNPYVQQWLSREAAKAASTIDRVWESVMIEQVQQDIEALKAGQQALARQVEALAGAMEGEDSYDVYDLAADPQAADPCIPESYVPYPTESFDPVTATALAYDQLLDERDQRARDEYANQPHDEDRQATECEVLVVVDPDDPFDKVIIEILELNRRKRADYTSGGPFDNFKHSAGQVNQPAGVGLEVLLATKQARLRTLLFAGREPNNESIRDSVLDRAVYAVIGLAMWDDGLYDDTQAA